MRFPKILGIGSLLLLLGGCSDFGFYWQAASGHLDLLSRKQDIQELIQNPGTDPELSRKLKLVLEVREFAVSRLSLPEKAGYTGYVDLGRPYVTKIVRAAPKLKLEAYQWCYWFIGCQEYRGYFDAEEALRYAEGMEEDLDVSVRSVSAYSTLGWLNQPWVPDYFSDPVLSTFVKRKDADLAATLIHEMAHQVVYVKNDTSFNESFATFVEEEGLEQFFQERIGSGSSEMIWYRSARRDRERFRQLVLDAYEKLHHLYGSELEDSEKLQNKKRIFNQLKQAFAEQKDQFEVLRYSQWFSQELNNTHLLGIRRYHRDTEGFRRLFEKEGREWKNFFARVLELADKPKDERKMLLNQER